MADRAWVPVGKKVGSTRIETASTSDGMYSEGYSVDAVWVNRVHVGCGQ